MSKLLKTSVVVGLIAAAIAAYPQTNVYTAGRSIKDQGITIKSWGSGTIAESDDCAFQGSTSLRISCRNYFQGGIVTFAKALAVDSNFADKNSLLEIALYTTDAKTTFSGKGSGGLTPGAPGGMGAAGMGMPGAAGKGSGQGKGGSGGVKGGGPGGIGMPGMGGGKGMSGTPTEQQLKKIRLIVTTTDGLRSEAFIDVTGKVADSRGWAKVGVPLQAILGLERTNKTIASIAISGDSPNTFFIGEMKVMVDPTPIYAEPNVREMNLALGDEITLSASGSAGSSALKYEWNFDSKGEFVADAEGQVVKRRFRSPGEYIITLRVSDVFGLKKPYSTTIKVVVNP